MAIEMGYFYDKLSSLYNLYSPPVLFFLVSETSYVGNINILYKMLRMSSIPNEKKGRSGKLISSKALTLDENRHGMGNSVQ